MSLAKWLYPGGRPNWLASVANRCSAVVHALGIARDYLVTLEVRGRRSARIVSLPAVVGGERLDAPTDAGKACSGDENVDRGYPQCREHCRKAQACRPNPTPPAFAAAVWLRRNSALSRKDWRPSGILCGASCQT